MSKFKRRNKTINNLPAKQTDPINKDTKDNKGGNGVVKSIMTYKKKKFVQEYLVDFNGSQAAIRAGYSKNGAGVIACNLLKDNKIQSAIAKRQLELQEETQWNQRKVLDEYRRLLDFDLADIYDNDHKLKKVSEMSPNARFAVAAIKSQKRNVKKIKASGDEESEESFLSDLKFTPKKEILDKIGEHLGMFASDKETPSGGIQIDKAVITVKLVD